MIEMEWTNREARRLVKRLRRPQQELFPFVRDPQVPFEKNYDPYCTPLSGSQAISLNRRLSDSFSPFFLTGRSSPTGS